jgi:hypothetical protein
MSTNRTFTFNIEPIGDHLQVHIPELDITVETAPGETSRDAATLAGTRAITAHLEQQRKRRARKQQPKAS